MSNILTFLLSFLLLYKYWALSIAVLLSAIIVPIPVSSLLLATGAFASQGYFSFFWSLTIVVLINIVGDCFDYFLAKKYGHRALRMLHIRIPDYFERLERFVRKYPGWAIFITRFVGTIEPLTSLLCGFIGIRFRKFLFWDFLGNVVSNGALLYAGYFLGVHWQDFNKLFNTTSYILMGIIIIIGISVMMWTRKKNSPTKIS